MSPRFRFILRRLASLPVLLAAVVIVVFALQAVTPGDTARLILGPRASEADVAQLRGELGLDESLPSQSLHYLEHAATGDLGESVRSKKPVIDVIAQRLPTTVWLLLSSFLISLVLTFPAAILAARKRDRAADHAVRGATLLALTIPAYWLGVMLIAFVALPTGWFPVAGFEGDLGQKLRSIALPALTLAVAMAPMQIRGLRSNLIALRRAPFMDTARAAGVRPRSLLYRHELPNSLPPVLNLFALQLTFFLFGAVLVEATFSLGGLGQGMVEAVNQRDFPVVQGITLVFAVAVVLAYLVADVLTALIDPRLELR